MDTSISISPLDWNKTLESSPSHGKSKQPASANQIRDAAHQFEALMLGQMLKQMRSSDGEGWFGTGDDSAGSQMAEFGEQMLAQMLSQKGGLGLTGVIEQGLTRKTAEVTAAQAEGGRPNAATPAAAGSPPAPHE
jgi:Rod binding domain-containing protein